MFKALSDFGQDTDFLITRAQAGQPTPGVTNSSGQKVAVASSAGAANVAVNAVVSTSTDWSKWIMFGVAAALAMGIAYRFVR